MLLVSLWACNNSADPQQEVPDAIMTVPADSAQIIIDAALKAHGATVLSNSIVDFDFRSFHFKVTRRSGSFAYERSFRDSSGQWVRDVLTNANFMREVNGKKALITAQDSAGYANSVNSVVYFALLPYFLNDKAVQKKYLGQSTLKGQVYDKIEVTFASDGGGKDFDDRYVYWFHRQQHTMDYLAYNFQVDGGGARFREAVNVRTVNGVRFADYVNYKPKADRRDIEKFDTLLESNELEKISDVKTENVKVLIL